jgi:hypothetical protein
MLSSIFTSSASIFLQISPLYPTLTFFIPTYPTGPPHLQPPTTSPSSQRPSLYTIDGGAARRRPPAPAPATPPFQIHARRPRALHGAPRRQPQIEARRIWRQIELLSGLLIFGGGVHIGRRGGESGTFLLWWPPLPPRAPAAESRGHPRRPPSAAPRGDSMRRRRHSSLPATAGGAAWKLRGAPPPTADAPSSISYSAQARGVGAHRDASAARAGAP